jgi:hypothetical protein
MAYTSAQLEELRERRRQMAGIRSTTFSDQSTTFDLESLDREIARAEREVRGTSGTRYAATSKGV